MKFLLNKWNEYARKTALPPLRVPEIFQPKKPKDGHILDLYITQQIDSFSCVVIAGWSVVKTLRPETRSFKSFYVSCNPGLDGTSMWKLISCLKEYDINTRTVRKMPSFNVIKKAILAGKPIITAIKVPGKDYEHCITVYGYCEKQQIYIANNKLDRVMSYARFKELYTDMYIVCSL